MKFRIYYAIWDGIAGEYKYWTYEGRGFDDALKADTEGCQVIIQENPDKVGKERPYDTISMFDLYAFRPDQGWVGLTEQGFHSYCREKGFSKYWIYGYSLLNGPFQECHKRSLREGLGG